MSANIIFNINIPPKIIETYFEGQAKVEAAKRENTPVDYSVLGPLLVALIPLAFHYWSKREANEPTPGIEQVSVQPTDNASPCEEGTSSDSSKDVTEEKSREKTNGKKTNGKKTNETEPNGSDVMVRFLDIFKEFASKTNKSDQPKLSKGEENRNGMVTANKTIDLIKMMFTEQGEPETEILPDGSVVEYAQGKDFCLKAMNGFEDLVKSIP